MRLICGAECVAASAPGGPPSESRSCVAPPRRLTTRPTNAGFISRPGKFWHGRHELTGLRDRCAAFACHTAMEDAGQISTWPVGGGKVSAPGHGYGASLVTNAQWDDGFCGVRPIRSYNFGVRRPHMSRSFVDSLAIPTTSLMTARLMAISDIQRCAFRGYASLLSATSVRGPCARAGQHTTAHITVSRSIGRGSLLHTIRSI